jgi:hypothetical protein
VPDASETLATRITSLEAELAALRDRIQQLERRIDGL